MPDSGNLINGETMTGTFTLEKRTGTLITLETEEKYVPKTIELTVDAQSATPSFKGGTPDCSNSSVTLYNMTETQYQTSGISFEVSVDVTRTPVKYNGAVNGWVSASDNDVALSSATRTVSLGGYKISGVTLTKGHAFDITVPNGTSTITFHFSVDNSGNVTIT